MKTKPYTPDEGNNIYYCMIRRLYHHDDFTEYELAVSLSQISYDTTTECKNIINKS